MAIMMPSPEQKNVFCIKSDIPGNSRSGFYLKIFYPENEGCFSISITDVWLSRLKSRNRQRSFFKSFFGFVKISWMLFQLGIT
jgi:hypothetical protein